MNYFNKGEKIVNRNIFEFTYFNVNKKYQFMSLDIKYGYFAIYHCWPE